MRLLPLVAAGLLSGGMLAACSDGSGPDTNVGTGTFAVTAPFFDVQGIGPCGLPAFDLTISHDQAGTPQFSLVDLTYSCAMVSGNVPLYYSSFSTVGDSLEVIYTDDTLSLQNTLVLRWKPSAGNQTGRATLDPTGGGGPATVLWSGVRQ
jgi:hypothetical protein